MARDNRQAAFPASGHDHTSCLTEAVRRAEQLFDARGMKLTEQRREVLAEIASSHNAIGAYEILDRLAAKGRRLAPISIYRALDALVEAGAIHRLESRNAFFACHARHMAVHDQVVLACERCGRVAEVEARDAYAALARSVRSTGFKSQRTVVEVVGICADCEHNAGAGVP